MNIRIIDTFCLINIIASGRSEDILTDKRAFYIDKSVPDQIFLNAYDDKTKTWSKKKRVDISPLLNSDKVLPWKLETKEEYESYLSFAGSLSDIEAEALALGKTRKWVVATDDRKTMNIAKENGIKTISTLEIIVDWARRNKIDKQTLDDMLEPMEQQANFDVSSQTPGYTAWSKYVK